MLGFKPIFLLKKSVDVPKKGHSKYYDEINSLNMSQINGKPIPTILNSSYFQTESKSFAEPGDDDPDRDAEICY